MSARRPALATVLLALLALASLSACGRGDRPPPGVVGDPLRGKEALAMYACHSCHIIPGVTGPKVYVGRPLDTLAKRNTIAGGLPNTQENLVRWIRDPQSLEPRTAMPDMGVTERDAIDISAYLLSR